jgi:hypothetical protein
MPVVPNGAFLFHPVFLNRIFELRLELAVRSVTAIADKLDLEFALFHRKRDGKAHDAPEKMELLVGDVKGRVCSSLSLPLVLGSPGILTGPI